MGFCILYKWQTIPIYYGCRGVVKYFNEDGIIFLDDDFNIDSLTENLYYSKIDAVRENFEIVQNFPVAEDYIYQNYLTEYSKWIESTIMEI